jgi:glutamate racemase
MFDSGVGGLTIFRSIHSLLPKESILYVGDHCYGPYGNKSIRCIKERGVKVIQYLISNRSKLIVIACNTATVAGIEYFRRKFPSVPIVGVVPVVKTAASVSKTKHFIVLSTSFTAKSRYQKHLIHTFAPHCTVTSIGSDALVPLIEEGHVDSPQVRVELQRLLHYTKENTCDVVVLGCTHYPFVRPAIRAIVGTRVTILDSGGAVARQVNRILTQTDNLSGMAAGSETFLTTGDSKKAEALFRQLLSEEVKVSHVTL